jgi:hypothetical protein
LPVERFGPTLGEVRGIGLFALWIGILAAVGPATAIVMDDQDAARRDIDDPWVTGHVGTVAGGGLTVVYLGEGWVLTARHVGARDVEIDGEVYRKASDSVVEIYNEDRTVADLIAYRILGNPELPDLPPLEISESTPSKGAFAILAGAGHEKARDDRSLASALRRIWSGRARAGPTWGTNTIADTRERVTIGESVTEAITTEYSLVDDLFATRYEAQAVTGDSGGALFVADGDEFVLAGVLFAASKGDPYGSEPSRTFAVDLASYRRQIISAIEAEKAGKTEDVSKRAAKPRVGPRSGKTPWLVPWAAAAGSAVVLLLVFVLRRVRTGR